MSDVEQSVTANPLPGARIVMSFQYLLVTAYLFGAVGLMLTAAARTGNYQGLLSPGLERFGDPKAYIPPVGPDSVWNPLTWVFGLSRVVCLFMGPLAFIAGLAGLVYLLRLDGRAHRRTFVWLATGTAVCAALVAFTKIPYGAQLQNWLLD